MSGWLTNGITLATLPLTGNERLPADTNLTSGQNPESEAITMSQAAMYFGAGGTVPWVVGRFYGAPPSTTPVSILTVTATTYAYPLYIPASTIKSVSIGVATGQTAANARVALYADNGAGYPGALTTDFGAIGAMTATATVTSTLSSSIAVNSGLYWVSSIFTASGTFPSVMGATAAYTNPLAAQLGFGTALAATAPSGNAPTGISVAGTYGAFPATFATAATLTVNAATPVAILGV